MNRLIKALPLMAVILGLTVFLGNAASKAIAQNTATDQEWMFDNEGNPADQDSYDPAPPNTQNDCETQDETVCVILAPADSEGKPNFDEVEGLEAALQTGASHQNIIRGPYNPQ